MKIKKENGFTLIELMVVLVIIIVVIGLGISAYFANLPHLRLGAATRGFRDDLMRAQQFAAKENRTVRVTQVSATSYEIVRITGAQDAPCAALVDDVNVKTVDLANQYKNTVTIGSYTAPCAQSLVFGKLGAIENSATTFVTGATCGTEFRVDIQRADGTETMSICINNEGRIRIQ